MVDYEKFKPRLLQRRAELEDRLEKIKRDVEAPFGS